MLAQDQITEQNFHWNFNTFLEAFMYLFRCSTGEGWDEVMFYYERGRTGLLMKIVIRILFLIFIFLTSFIFLNLFVLIITEEFEKFYFDPNNPLSSFEKLLEEFSKIWNIFSHNYQGRKIK